MNSRLLLIASLLLCASSSVSAQLQKLLDNPDITWVAEFSTDYSFSPNAPYNTEFVKVTKFYSSPSTVEGDEVNKFLPLTIFYDGLKGKKDCYKDPGLTQKLSKEALDKMIVSIDTVITFYPETFEETVHIVKNEMDPAIIKKVRVNQVIYFDSKTKEFNTLILALAPMAEVSNTGALNPLFWVKMDTPFPKGFDIHSSVINWGVLAYSYEQPLALNFIEEHKNIDFNLPSILYKQAINLEKPIESPDWFGNGDYYDKRDIELTYSSIDTITTFDPKTFEETVTVVKNEINPKKVNQFRLVQEWYYDAEKHQVFNRLKAICPLVPITDANKNFRYNKNLYYIRYNMRGLKKS